MGMPSAVACSAQSIRGSAANAAAVPPSGCRSVTVVTIYVPRLLPSRESDNGASPTVFGSASSVACMRLGLWMSR